MRQKSILWNNDNGKNWPRAILTVIHSQKKIKVHLASKYIKVGVLLHKKGPLIVQRVLGLTWRPRRMSFFVSQKPVEISKNDSNTN